MNVCLCATPVRMTLCVGCVLLRLSDLSQDRHPVVFCFYFRSFEIVVQSLYPHNMSLVSLLS